MVYHNKSWILCATRDNGSWQRALICRSEIQALSVRQLCPSLCPWCLLYLAKRMRKESIEGAAGGFQGPGLEIGNVANVHHLKAIT